MNFSEFIKRLGTDPASQDPAFLRARDFSPEFQQAVRESDRDERLLRHAVELPMPFGLLQEIKSITAPKPLQHRPWARFAMAASVLLVVAAAGMAWRMNSMSFDSVEQYVVYHYSHDGDKVLAGSNSGLASNLQEVLADLDVEMTPGVAGMVSLVKFCPTPDGVGAHLVLNTDNGPITVIFMPHMAVSDGEMLAFDGMQAQLVSLESGSAAVIGAANQNIASFHNLVQSAFIPLASEA